MSIIYKGKENRFRSTRTRRGSDKAVISMLQHFFNLCGLKECYVALHADNCVGQNKNNMVLQWLLWRVGRGSHLSFRLSFLPVGHTKFSPDLYFGLFKKSFRLSKCGSIIDVVKVAVTVCPHSNLIVAIAVGDENSICDDLWLGSSFFKCKNCSPFEGTVSFLFGRQTRCSFVQRKSRRQLNFECFQKLMIILKCLKLLNQFQWPLIVKSIYLKKSESLFLHTIRTFSVLVHAVLPVLVKMSLHVCSQTRSQTRLIQAEVLPKGDVLEDVPEYGG